MTLFNFAIFKENIVPPELAKRAKAKTATNQITYKSRTLRNNQNKVKQNISFAVNPDNTKFAKFMKGKKGVIKKK